MSLAGIYQLLLCFFLVLIGFYWVLQGFTGQLGFYCFFIEVYCT